MNDGQQSDYNRLREMGVSWSDAMDFMFDHPLGNTNIQHLRNYAKKVLEKEPAFDALKIIEEKIESRNPPLVNADNLQAWAMVACAQQLKRLADQGNPVDHGTLTTAVVEAYKVSHDGSGVARQLLKHYEIRHKK